MTGKPEHHGRFTARKGSGLITPKLKKVLPDGDYAVVASWFESLTKLVEAEAETAAALTEMMGDHRESPVMFRWAAGDDAQMFLRQLLADNPPKVLADHYQLLAARLRENGGYLIVALALGSPPS